MQLARQRSASSRSSAGADGPQFSSTAPSRVTASEAGSCCGVGGKANGNKAWTALAAASRTPGCPSRSPRAAAGSACLAVAASTASHRPGSGHSSAKKARACKASEAWAASARTETEARAGSNSGHRPAGTSAAPMQAAQSEAARRTPASAGSTISTTAAACKRRLVPIDTALQRASLLRAREPCAPVPIAFFSKRPASCRVDGCPLRSAKSSAQASMKPSTSCFSTSANFSYAATWPAVP
mmetsp:Transcript_128047/g.410319  ORF Transcript_128047/g.410319 Transcript_128047/m.410319 type:complete len:241 (+) Transcript_128047:1932-2654(+)